jgi:hypothetical protein
MPASVPGFPTLLVLAAFAYPVGLAVRELAWMLGFVTSEPTDLVVDTANRNSASSRWQNLFVQVHQKVSGSEWQWPPLSAYEKGIEQAADAEEDEIERQRIVNLVAVANSCAVFGPCAFIGGLMLIMRGFGRLDPIALAFAFLALLVGAVLILAGWISMGRVVERVTSRVDFDPVPPPVETIIESGNDASDSPETQSAEPQIADEAELESSSASNVEEQNSATQTVADSYDDF